MRREKEILIDAISPSGSLALLLEQFYLNTEKYLENPNKKCMGGFHKGYPMSIRKLNENDSPKGTRYKLKISLED